MDVKFNGQNIHAVPVTQDEKDCFSWLADRIDSEPLIKFHLESLIKQRIDQMNDEMKELLLQQVKDGFTPKPKKVK
jgi:hypothetical protein